jgi:hypothetical protein
VRGEQGWDSHVPARRITGGEVRGEGKLQGLMAVRLSHMLRVEVVGKGISMKARSNGGGVNDDGDAPAADVDGGPVHELQ